MEKISVLLIGIGGYGVVYVKGLLYGRYADMFQIVGAVDPYAEKSTLAALLCSRKIPIYAAVEEFYREQKANLAIIATPIYLHGTQARYCMDHGSDVLCEKPICATLEDAVSMITTRNRTGRRLAIGFQWCYSESVLRLKQDILNGLYGTICQIRTLVFFPRTLDYYTRSTGWAGKKRMASGEWVFDSVASNATAHYLQNMLFLTGTRMDRAAEVTSMQAEVYRANPIEMYDTCAFRIWTEENVELLFYATHAVPLEWERMPVFVLEGKKGTVVLQDNVITGRLKTGQIINYGEPCADALRVLSYFRDADKEHRPMPCVAETAIPHLKCVYSVAESFPNPPRFAEKYLRFNEEARQYTCEGLAETLESCWKEGKLPYEMQAAWAQKPHEIQLKAEFTFG